MPHRLPLRWMLACGLLCLELLAVAQESHAATLTPAQAQEHIGETATVCGVVASATWARRARGAPTFLNLDEPYPRHLFTAVIWGRDRAKFVQPEAMYKDKRICVVGTIEAFHKKQQIVVTDPSQISEGAAAAARSYRPAR